MNFMKKVAMPIIFHMPPWSAMWLMWGLSYFRFHAEMFSAELTSFSCKTQLEGEKFGNIRRKYNGTQTKITYPPLKLHLLPRWHKKDNWYSYLFIKCLTGY